MTSSVDLDIWLREKLPFDFDLLPAEAYLVGGAVRDVLLGREREYLDLDFVLPANSIPLAKKIAHICQAGFVILDQTREIARVVFAQGTVDFAKQEGATLEEDLYHRDFTINAIAYQPSQKKIIDPLGGKRDLEQKLVRMVSVQNLKDDPLRLIRAYRQAGQLDLNIEIETRKQIIKLAPLLQQVAAERVKTEINYMLETPQGTAWLIEAISDGLLVDWLPTTDKQLKKLATIEQTKDYFTIEAFKAIDLQRSLFLAKLATLCPEEPEKAQLLLEKLKYSRAEIKAVTTAIAALPKLLASRGKMSLREQYFWFLEVKDYFFTVIILALNSGLSWQEIQPLLLRYLDKTDIVAHPQPIITGRDLIEKLSLKPSPLIGKLLTEVYIAYIEGKVTDQASAIAYAKNFLSANHYGHFNSD